MKSTLFLLAVSATVHTDSLPRDQDLQSQIVTVEPRSVVQVDISSKVTHQLRAPVIPGFIPTFFDDFSGLPGSLPSRENWIINIGTQYPGGSERWGNIENQYYTDSTDNLRITSDGTLEFVPLLDVPGTGETGNWTSGRIETNRTDFAAVAGGQLYVETRVKVGAGIPSQQAGMWCAFWALGAIFRGHHSNWPEASEWDILEVLGGNDMLYSTLHCDVVPVGACNEYEGLRNEGVPYSKHDWHRLGFLVDRSMTGEGGLGTWEDVSTRVSFVNSL